MRLWAALTALLGAACGTPAPKPGRFELQFQAQSTDGEPLAEVRFWADGRQLGISNLSGQLRASLQGLEGQAVSLTTACPPAYRTLEAQRSLVLRRVQGTQGPAPALELRARCAPIERTLALVVRASGPEVAGLPIRVRGEVVGQTGRDGLAHLLLRSRPRSSLRVSLDTSDQPALRPRSPVHTFEVGEADAVVLLEQAFERPAHARKRRAPTIAPKLPYRID